MTSWNEKAVIRSRIRQEMLLFKKEHDKNPVEPATYLSESEHKYSRPMSGIFGMELGDEQLPIPMDSPKISHIVAVLIFERNNTPKKAGSIFSYYQKKYKKSIFFELYYIPVEGECLSSPKLNAYKQETRRKILKPKIQQMNLSNNIDVLYKGNLSTAESRPSLARLVKVHEAVAPDKKHRRSRSPERKVIETAFPPPQDKPLITKVRPTPICLGSVIAASKASSNLSSMTSKASLSKKGISIIDVVSLGRKLQQDNLRHSDPYLFIPSMPDVSMCKTEGVDDIDYKQERLSVPHFSSANHWETEDANETFENTVEVGDSFDLILGADMDMSFEMRVESTSPEIRERQNNVTSFSFASTAGKEKTASRKTSDGVKKANAFGQLATKPKVNKKLVTKNSTAKVTALPPRGKGFLGIGSLGK